MQAESSLEQMDWIDKINGVIASLLTSQPERVGICREVIQNDIHYINILLKK